MASYTLRHNGERAICARFPKFLRQPSQTPQFAVEINGADLCAELESLGCPRAQCKWDVICNLVSVARGERDGNIPSERLECVPPRFCTGGMEVGPVGTSGLGASEGEAVSLIGGGEGRRMD